MTIRLDAFAQPQDRSATIGPRFDYLALAPAAAAICYPFLLRAFHAVVGTQATMPSPLAIVGATLILARTYLWQGVARPNTSRASMGRLHHSTWRSFGAEGHACV